MVEAGLALNQANYVIVMVLIFILYSYSMFIIFIFYSYTYSYVEMCLNLTLTYSNITYVSEHSLPLSLTIRPKAFSFT